MVLAFLLLAVDVLLGLHARSAVTAVAYEAARDVAVAGDEAIGVRSSAERRARRSLGAVGAEATFTWRIDADEVTLEVAGERPGALLDAVGLRTREFRRTVTVRRELVR